MLIIRDLLLARQTLVLHLHHAKYCFTFLKYVEYVETCPFSFLIFKNPKLGFWHFDSILIYLLTDSIFGTISSLSYLLVCIL